MKRYSMLGVLSGVVLFLSLVACGPERDAADAALATEIDSHRSQKDSLFRVSPHSPIPEEERSDFAGLKYFPVDPELRFDGPIIRYDNPQPDTIVGTKGDLRPALKYGYFPFIHDGEEYRLQVYKMIRDDPGADNYLFLGFTDRTTGNSTYGTGRYIDLTENPANYYRVDFNLAYNPYCAYNPRYSCAVPSPENPLDLAVTAGEKIYKAH